MAKNTNSVTALHGDNAKGPVYYNPDLTIAVDADTDYSTGGWLQLGYGSTDGISIAQTADDTSKDVWGASLGTVYSNFADIVTLHMASFYDEDVAKVIYGSDNVTVGTDNIVHVKVKARQGSKGTFVINATNDNGDSIQHIYRGQTDPNFSIDAAEGDIITFDLPVKGISAADGTTSEFSFPKAGSDPTISAVAITTTGGSASGLPSTVAVGSTASVAAELTMSDGTKVSKLTEDSRLTWKSSNSTVATVSSGGVITGVKAGTAVITVAAGGKTSTPLTVTVTAAG